MFKSPFSFKGRIRRTEYGISVLIYLPLALFANALVESTATVLFALILYVPILWFIWAQGAKRCHDRGNTGLFQIIPFYGLWMLFAEGDQGPNEYGPDPKDKEKALINA